MNDDSIDFFESIFCVREINRVEDYERFRSTRDYLRALSARVPDSRRMTAALADLMALTGYVNPVKFRAHRREWDDLSRRIPLRYLSAIGCDVETLLHVVSVDREEFERALLVPLFPRIATVRLIAAVYLQRRIEECTPEADAVANLQDYACEHRLRCCINYPDLKTIWIEPNGNVFTTFYRPVIRITRAWAMIGYDGQGLAVTRIAT